MIRLSAFADEISPDLEEQLVVLGGEEIRHVELRSAWDINVLDWDDEQVAAVKHALGRHDIAVSAIGSPIGKAPIDTPLDEHLSTFDRALALANIFGAGAVRIFSFYPPSGSPSPSPATYRDEVVQRLRVMADRAEEQGVLLLHENEKGIYGDTIPRCVDLMTAVASPHLQSVLDPANFIQCGQTPYPDAYDALRPWIRAIHVKDALPDGSVVAAGEGAGRWPDLLRRLRADGFDGFLSLEPHLAAAGQYRGFSGPQLFGRAVRALRELLDEMGWEYG